MGYIFGFFVNLIRSKIFAQRPSASDEEHPLIPTEDPSQQSLIDHQQSLTDVYKTWGESVDAFHYCIFHVLLYVTLAIVGYSFIFEDWPIVDSLYFAVVIFTTVGYGDLSPTNNISRAFTICFAFYGIVILGIFLSFLGEWIVQKSEDSKQRRLANARVKIFEQFSGQDHSAPPPDRTFLGDALDICLSLAPILVVLAILASPIIYLEGWDIIQGIYWMIVTGFTIGFGDEIPTKQVTRFICVLWIPLAVAVLCEFLGRVAGSIIERRNDEIEDRFLQRTMTIADLHTMDEDKDQKVSKHEFLSYMLVSMQKVEQDDIDEIMDLFKRLDVSKTGWIEKEDLLDRFQLSVRPGVTLGRESLVRRPNE